MSNRPANRSRFDVPIATRKPSGGRSRAGGSARFQNERRTWVNAGIVAGATVVTTVFLLAISGQIYDTTNADLVPRSPAPLVSAIVSTPSPLSTASPTPTRSSRTESTPTPESEAPSAPDDTEIQAAVDNKLSGDESLAALGITATVNEGKVILVGKAPTDELKSRVEKLVRSVRGVRQVDNQIAVVIDEE